MTTKAFSLAKIQVADIEAAERSYVEALGLEVVARVTQGEGPSLMFERILAVTGAAPNTPSFILISYPNLPCPAAGEATIGFMVEALETSVERAVAAGATVEVAPMDVPEFGLRLAFLLDPQGHRIELLQTLKNAPVAP